MNNEITDLKASVTVPEYAEAFGDDSASRADQAFCIDTAGRANWIVRNIVQARQYRDRVRTWAHVEVRRSERTEARLFYRFGRQLEEWARQELRASGDDRKSVHLPGGTIGFRAVAARLRINDQAAVINWAKGNMPAAIIVKEQLSKTAITEHFNATGELPDRGATIEDGHEEFFVR